MIRIPTIALYFLIGARLYALDIVVNVQHATCGDTTGSIWTYGTNGVPPFSYLWSTGATTSALSNMSPGIYTLTVTDSQGAVADTTLELLQTTALFPPMTPAYPAWACGTTCTGTWYAYVPLSGTGPYTVVFDPPGPVGNANPNGLSFNGLCPGEEYTVTVMDANGCTGIVTPLEVFGSMAPQLVNSVITGSCPGGATGTLSLEFDHLDSILVSGTSGSTYWLSSDNPFVIDDIPPGVYEVWASTSQYNGGLSNPGGYCDTSFTVVIPVSTEPCGSISGVLYADLDGNCDQDVSELGLPNRVLSIGPDDQYVLTNSTGGYYTELFYNDYTLDVALAGYDASCIALPTPFTLDASTPSATIDLAMEPQFGPDVSTFLSAGAHRPGFPVTYQVTLTNEGPYPFSDLTLDLFYDPMLIFNSAEGPSTLLNAGYVQWSLPALGGYSSLTFAVSLNVPANASLIGTVVSSDAVVMPQSPDADPSNNNYGITRTIVGAYDPNDKLARTDRTNNDQIFFLDLDSYVDYTIRFQNTGTAEAINVFLLDTIAAEYDLSTLRILGASHAFEATLLPGRVLRFDFPNIMLPDSTSDLLGSQGFASFRLWPFPGMEPGDHLLNAADIFFDFNEPIRTNTSDLVAEYSVGLSESTRTTVSIFPNPVSERLQVNLPEGSWQAELVALDGRIVASHRLAGPKAMLDAAALAPGSYVLHLTNTGTGATLNTRFMKEAAGR